MAMPSSGSISFSQIRDAYNAMNPGFTITSVSLSNLRGKQFNDNSSVPQSDVKLSDFRGKTWKDMSYLNVAPVLYWSKDTWEPPHTSGQNGTPGNPYNSKTPGTFVGSAGNNKTAWIEYTAQGAGYVWVYSYAETSCNYGGDYAQIWIQGQNDWNSCGHGKTYAWKRFQCYYGFKVKFSYVKDGTTDWGFNGSDKQTAKIFTSAYSNPNPLGLSSSSYLRSQWNTSQYQ